MDTYTLSKGYLSTLLASLSVEEKAWAIKFLTDHLAVHSSKKVHKRRSYSEAWRNYTISPEVMAMTISRRKDLSDDYRQGLTELLEEKYR